MKQRTAALLAAAITTFVVVATVAVLLAMPGAKQANAQSTTPSVATVPAGTTSTVLAREQAYKQQIEQANAQLQEAYRQIEQLQAQNQILLQREQTYEQRLQQANAAIQAQQNAAQRSFLAFGDHDEGHDDD